MSVYGVHGPLRTNPVNPRYFTDDSGRAILLVGAHTWNNLLDIGLDDPPAKFDFEGYLDFLVDHNHNFIRLWTWDMFCTWRTDHVVTPLPWPRCGPGLAIDGKPRFDLTQYDAEYFDRLHSRVAAAQARGIYVDVMLLESWCRRCDLRWHVFANDNNVNGVDILCDGVGRCAEHWMTLADPDVLMFQKAYIKKVVDTVNEFDNVLYEISNEAGPLSHDWQDHLVAFVRDCESSKPKQHAVGMTGGMGTSEQRTYESQADWVSPDAHSPDVTGDPYRWAQATWGEMPFDRGDKVVILDTDHLWGIGGDEVWAWKGFCRGYNVIYMDPWYDMPAAFFDHPTWQGIGVNENLRRELGSMRALADTMDLNVAVPHSELASTGYCLANPGGEYVAFQPTRGALQLCLCEGTYDGCWHEPSTGCRHEFEGISTDDGIREFTPPFDGPAVLRLCRNDRQTTRNA